MTLERNQVHMSKIYIFFWKEKAVIQNLVNINKDCDVCWACQVVLEVKNPPANAGDVRHGFDPWVEKIPWRRAWQPTPVFLSGESHGQRSLAGFSPWGRKELDTT